MSLTELTGNPRHDQLLMLIAERGYMNIDELANLLDVSTQTVRRDIRKLSEQGLITRHHGGAGRASSVVNTAFEQREVSQTEEKKAIARAEEEDTKIPTVKTQWTEDDDCYYFMTYTTWQDYPVLPPVMGEGFDENNVSVIYDKNGIQSLSINGYYPLELKNEVEVVSPEMALKALEKYFGNIISDDIYEVQRISLCQKVVQVNPDKHSAEIEPVWECRVLVKNSDLPDSSYLQKIYFHAETLKVM